MEINDATIAIYRDVYYEHEKPLLKSGTSEEEITKALLPVLVMYGWTLDIYFGFKYIDLMQRLTYITDIQKLKGRKLNIHFVAGDEEIDYTKSYKYPELRCPIRSEEKRNLN